MPDIAYAADGEREDVSGLKSSTKVLSGGP